VLNKIIKKLHFLITLPYKKNNVIAIKSILQFNLYLGEYFYYIYSDGKMNIMKKKYSFVLLIGFQLVFIIVLTIHLNQNLFHIYSSNLKNSFKSLENFLRIQLAESANPDSEKIRTFIADYPEIKSVVILQNNQTILKVSKELTFKNNEKKTQLFHSVVGIDTLMYDVYAQMDSNPSLISTFILIVIFLFFFLVSFYFYIKQKFARKLVDIVESTHPEFLRKMKHVDSDNPEIITFDIVRKFKKMEEKIAGAEDRVQFLNHILDEINEPIIILNQKLKIIYANNRIHSLLEMNHHNKIDLKDILRDHYEPVIGLLRTEKNIKNYKLSFSEKQFIRYFMLNARMFEHLGDEYYVLIFDDRTEMIVTQESLKETKMKLEKLNTSYAKKIMQLDLERHKNEKNLYYRYFLLETIAELSRTGEIKEIGRLLIQKMQNYFNISFGAFYVSETNGNCWLVFSKNYSNFSYHADKRINIKNPFFDKIFEQNFPYLIDDELITDEKTRFFTFPDEIIPHGLMIPILERDRSLGFILLFKSSEELFTMEEINVLDALSKHISIILYNQFLLKELNQKKETLEITLEELKQSQERILQLQKMESLERLVGGIAHDFNNILGIIIPTSELLLLHSSLSEEDKEKVEMIRDAAKRASYLTRQFLVFGREQKSILYPMNLNKYIEDSMFLFSKMLSDDIKLVFKPCNREFWIMADRAQIFQVISNLIINSVDAIHEKNIKNGYIEIGTFDGKNPLYSKYFENSDIHSSGVGFYVKDNGPGIPDDIKSRILDPFFSTKEQNKGSGLGLTIVYAIIKNQHNGEIFIESREGAGTNVIIILPEISPVDDESVLHKEPDFLPMGNESILVIDDEEFLRQSLRILFEKLGYTVYLAGGGKEGIEKLKEHPEIALAIVDLAMPQMDGLETIQNLKKLKKEIGIILLTGYLEEVNRLSDSGLINDICLKPFDIYELSTIVRNIIDKKMKVQYGKS
jgi:signal transduction histidine kinase/PAS domain-containing protein